MSGLYNLMGQFGGMFNNWQTNQYNQSQDQWQQQYDQYQQDMDYYNQMNEYDQQRSGYDQWRSGHSRGAPIVPREQPGVIGPRPSAPSQFDFGGFGGGGFGGQSGWNSSPPPQGGGFNYGEFSGPGYQAQAAWENPGIDTANMVDPSAVIAGAQPGIMESMQGAFADAGNRFGSSGMVGTPYAGALGEASRGAANDIANITNQYQFQAASDQANREQQRALAEYGADYNAWAQQGDWGHQGQLADMNQAMNAWGQMGDWQNQQNLQGGNLANQQWMAQNNWNFDDYQMQQNQMQQMMPLFMQMMGGGMY